MRRTLSGSKTCVRCHKTKPRRDFYPNVDQPDRRSPWCIKCTKPRGKREGKPITLTAAELRAMGPTNHTCIHCREQIMKYQAYGNAGRGYYHIRCGGSVS